MSDVTAQDRCQFRRQRRRLIAEPPNPTGIAKALQHHQVDGPGRRRGKPSGDEGTGDGLNPPGLGPESLHIVRLDDRPVDEGDEPPVRLDGT